jgi:hypothetical protein
LDGGEKVKAKLTLSGFLASLHCPTEERLYGTVDATRLLSEEYMNFIRELQDVLHRIDVRHRGKPLSGLRGIKARYVRVSANERRRRVKFSPYPNRWLNELKHIRQKAYDLLNSYAIGIETLTQGYYKDKIYLLARGRVREFLSAVERLDRELDEIRMRVREYDYSNIKALLRKYGLDWEVEPAREVGHIRADLLPVSFSTAIQEWATKDPKVAQQLERQERELIEQLLVGIRGRVLDIVKSIGKAKTERLLDRLKRLRETAEDLGLKALSETILVPLEEVVKKPETAPQVFGANPEEWVSSRVLGLLV